MNELKIEYKSDTGLSAFVEIGSLAMIEDIDTYPLQECDTVEDVIDLIDLCDYEWAVLMDNIPDKYNDNNDLKIYRPEYVEWLEEKLKLKL